MVSCAHSARPMHTPVTIIQVFSLLLVVLWEVQRKGASQKTGQDCLVLYIGYCCQLRHPQTLCHPRNTFKSSYDVALRCRLHFRCQGMQTAFTACLSQLHLSISPLRDYKFSSIKQVALVFELNCFTTIRCDRAAERMIYKYIYVYIKQFNYNYPG